MLNEQLKSYYIVEDRLQTLRQTTPLAKINGKLNASTVTIPMLGEDRSTVFYHLHVSEAEITYFDIPILDIVPGESEPVTAHVKDWDIPFKIDLSKEFSSKISHCY